MYGFHHICDVVWSTSYLKAGRKCDMLWWAVIEPNQLVHCQSSPVDHRGSWLLFVILFIILVILNGPSELMNPVIY